jgi:hypothetical protein
MPAQAGTQVTFRKGAGFAQGVRAPLAPRTPTVRGALGPRLPGAVQRQFPIAKRMPPQPSYPSMMTRSPVLASLRILIAAWYSGDS